MGVRERQIGRGEAPVVIEALASWTPAPHTGGLLHPGDIGWFLRFEESRVRAALRLWSDVSGPVAVTLLDGPVLRVGLAPRVAAAPVLAKTLAWEFDRTVGDGEARCDVPQGSPVGAALLRLGWTAAPDEPWSLFARGDLVAPPDVRPRTLVVGEESAADRVAVQRAAFRGSTFTLPRWRAMRGSAAAALCVESLAVTPDGAPAAVATGWLAGTGRCGLLEPVGTRPEHRGHGYGRAAVLAACAQLGARGASAVAVLTPSTNTAAVALYRSAGFREVARQRDLHRPARCP